MRASASHVDTPVRCAHDISWPGMPDVVSALVPRSPLHRTRTLASARAIN